MFRKPASLLCLAILLPAAVLAGATPQPGSPPTEARQICITVDGTASSAQRCCKVCKKGKACGDTCIAKEKTCHKGAGCACNG